MVSITIFPITMLLIGGLEISFITIGSGIGFLSS